MEEHEGMQQAIVNREYVFRSLLKDGRADVTALTIKDIVDIAKTLGWSEPPKIEFEGDKAFLRRPGWRARRSKTTQPARAQT